MDSQAFALFKRERTNQVKVTSPLRNFSFNRKQQNREKTVSAEFPLPIVFINKHSRITVRFQKKQRALKYRFWGNNAGLINHCIKETYVKK